jgi:hypothetical protein
MGFVVNIMELGQVFICNSVLLTSCLSINCITSLFIVSLTLYGLNIESNVK